MKNQAFISFMALLLLASVSFVGCDNDGGGGSSQDTQALTERDFFDNAGLSANPEKGVVVDFLEPPDSEKPESDTGEVGNDTIPYTYTRTLNNTFCWEDDDGEAGHFMELDDSDGNEIFRLDVNGECITVVLEAGDYLMHIHHDGRIEKTHPIFIIPEPNGEQEAQKIDTNEGLLKSAKSLFSKILNNLHNIITQTTNAQTPTPTPSENLTTLLKTNACQGCNLMGVDLSGANLTEANLTDANLTDAFLTDAFLTDAFLFQAILRGAFMSGANLIEAKMAFADLTGANLTGADLTGAFLRQAILIEADLTDANLTGVTLTGAVLTDANLTGVTLFNTIFGSAIWCDGTCLCGDNSIDTCIGCPSINTCT